VSAPVEDLEAVGGAVAKDEQMTGERVLQQPRADQVEQAIERRIS
jgi:hypothetical protein